MINVENVWKSYPVVKDRPGFKEFVTNLPKFLDNKNKFWALKGVSFQVNKGECIGIIGRNGAGKSTLLTLLLGSAQPSKGKIELVGKRTPLLELGAGFHQDMTGRENVIMNGILMGQTKDEVLAKMDEIIEFSGLEEFIDRPIRTYSSGMYMRLAFSVAINTDPEILLIDEILSVGDEFFQKKSNEAILKLIKQGITTVYVSHDMASVKKICTRVLWLEHGNVMADGAPDEVVKNYIIRGNDNGVSAC